jgi:hypothetical protein
MLKTNLKNTQTILKKVGVFTFVVFFLMSCAEESKRGNKEDGEKTEENKEDKDANLLKINGKVFSVPSPIQTAFLLKHSGAAYSSEMLSPTRVYYQKNIGMVATTMIMDGSEKIFIYLLSK